MTEQNIESLDVLKYKLQKYYHKLNSGHGDLDLYQQKIYFYEHMIGGDKTLNELNGLFEGIIYKTKLNRTDYINLMDIFKELLVKYINDKIDINENIVINFILFAIYSKYIYTDNIYNCEKKSDTKRDDLLCDKLNIILPIFSKTIINYMKQIITKLNISMDKLKEIYNSINNDFSFSLKELLNISGNITLNIDKIKEFIKKLSGIDSKIADSDYFKYVIVLLFLRKINRAIYQESIWPYGLPTVEPTVASTVAPAATLQRTTTLRRTTVAPTATLRRKETLETPIAAPASTLRRKETLERPATTPATTPVADKLTGKVVKPLAIGQGLRSIIESLFGLNK